MFIKVYTSTSASAMITCIFRKAAKQTGISKSTIHGWWNKKKPR